MIVMRQIRYWNEPCSARINLAVQSVDRDVSVGGDVEQRQRQGRKQSKCKSNSKDRTQGSGSGSGSGSGNGNETGQDRTGQDASGTRHKAQGTTGSVVAETLLRRSMRLDGECYNCDQ